MQAKSNDRVMGLDEVLEAIPFGNFIIFCTLVCGLTYASDSVEMTMVSKKK